VVKWVDELHPCLQIVIRLIIDFQNWGPTQIRSNFGPLEELYNLGNIVNWYKAQHGKITVLGRIDILENYIKHSDHVTKLDTKKIENE
jgi:hypothetical protein